MTVNLISLMRSIGENATEAAKREHINHFRKLNRICVIVEDKEIFLVKGQYVDIGHCIRQCSARGFVEVVTVEDGEEYRFISLSKVTEFTLGNLRPDSPEFLSPLEKSSNYVRSLLGMNSSFSNSNSFNSNP